MKMKLPPELRAQRNLNKSRIPEMSNYILDNSENYTFSALTVSIDSEVSFEPLPETGQARNITCSNECKVYHK